MAGTDEDRPEGFLARWSRLKRAAREGPADPGGSAGEASPAAAAPEAAAAAEEEVDLAALPRIEDLTPTSDITAFLRKGVPAGLRNAALRRMWSLDPAIRDYIGPVDYGWDWNTPGGVPDFIDRIGEGPEIRALAEKLFSPAPLPRPAAAPAAEPAGAGQAEPTAPDQPPAEQAEPAPPAVAVAAPEQAPPQAPEGPAPPGPGLPVRPRHGGAMPA